MEERLQKIIAHAGIASRRKAEELILEGKVTVNGKVVTELGQKADPERDHIKVNKKLIRPETLQYFAVYKPKGFLSSASDPENRPVITQLVPSGKRLYPAGRLDFNSEGLVILTNDGDLTRRLTTAGWIPKVYRVKVQGQPSIRKIEQLRKGVTVADGTQFSKCKIQLVKPGNNSWYEVTLFQGRNRQIRRMFDHIGHSVMRLRRTAIGTVKLEKLQPGQSRKLTVAEVKQLKGEEKQNV